MGLRIGFAGTPLFAQVALAHLHQAGHTIALVLTQPDRAAGRGMKLQASEVKQWATAHQIPVIQPQGLRLSGKFSADAALAQAALEQAQLDVLVVAAYGLILPAWVLQTPRYGCLNIHASLLPRWRGAAPIHRAIEAGDAQTGVTIMQMDEGLDTGDMLMIESENIALDDTTGALHDRLAQLGGRMMVEVLKRLEYAKGQGETSLPATAQPEQGVTYAEKIDKSERAINWRDSAQVLARRLHAFDPFPGMQFELKNCPNVPDETIKVWAAQALMDAAHIQRASQASPGTIIEVQPDRCWVACGQGVLALRVLQRAGGKRVDVRDFLRSLALPVGQVLQ